MLQKRLSLSTRKISGLVLILIALVPVYMGYAQGGYYVDDWGLAAFGLAILMILVAGLGLLGGARSRWSVVATTFFIVYAAWTFASILWSPNKGEAWYGASLTLIYVLVFWLTTTLVAMNAPRRWLFSTLAVGPPIIALITLPMLGPGASRMFLEGRLMGTVGYFNAEAAFLLVSFWIGVYVTGSRRVPVILRAAAMAGSTVALEVALLTQSRGAVVALVISIPVFFLFSGQRLRGLIACLPLLISVALAFPYLNGVFLDLADGGNARNAVSTPVAIIVATSAATGLFGLVWGILDSRWTPSVRLVKTTGTLTLICLLTFAVLATTFFAQREGNPISWTQDKWIAFKTDDTTGQTDGRYFSASGSGRFTLWEVAMTNLAEEPILGIGTHNYESTYYQERDKDIGWVKQPHSLPLEIISEKGITGAILFAGFFGTCIASGLWKRFRSLNAEGKAQTGAILACITYWLVHSSAEWFWQMPAVTIPAMIYLAVLVTPWNRKRSDEDVFAPSHRPLRLAGIGIAALVLVATGPLYIASRIEKSADESNPWSALATLETARRFNPLDASLAKREADLAYQIGDIPLATQSYATAIALNPEHYATYSVLGGVYEQLGQTEKARNLYEHSARLNPMDPSIRESVSRVGVEPAISDPASDTQ